MTMTVIQQTKNMLSNARMTVVLIEGAKHIVIQFPPVPHIVFKRSKHGDIAKIVSRFS